MRQSCSTPLLFFLAFFVCPNAFAQDTVTLLKSFTTEQVYLGMHDRVIASDDILFFVGFDEAYGHELWKSDGSSDGTVMVKDIYRGDKPDNISGLAIRNGELFFLADDGSGRFGHRSSQLWRSDGTPEGTVLLAETIPELKDVFRNMSLSDHSVALQGSIIVANSSQLWKTDGTPEGTVLLADQVKLESSFATIDDNILFGNNKQLWKTNGTPEGTVPLAEDLAVRSLTSLGDKVLFRGNGELWITDGTTEGTYQLKDIQEGPNPSFDWRDYEALTPFIVVNQTAYFIANDGYHGKELWKSDGTEEGTVMVADLTPGFNDTPIDVLTVGMNDQLFFTSVNRLRDRGATTLWKTDGTSEGTSQVKFFKRGGAGAPSPQLRHFQVVKETLYFLVYNGQLWKSDGTEEGTIPTSLSDGIQRTLSLSALNGALYVFGTERGPRPSLKLYRVESSR